MNDPVTYRNRHVSSKCQWRIDFPAVFTSHDLVSDEQGACTVATGGDSSTLQDTIDIDDILNDWDRGLRTLACLPDPYQDTADLSDVCFRNFETTFEQQF
mmetsp:Transcript_31254/g.83867  ORF Transcript_31254/g.83867 Transcript_31254/m.83867 type:complete len:100 (+) Transcript_31254:448-747(+)